MAKQTSTSDTKLNKKSQLHAEQTAISEQTPELVGLSELLGGSMRTAGDGQDIGQAARLSDPNIQTVQRQTMARQIGYRQGNQHLQRIIVPLNSNNVRETSRRKSTQKLQSSSLQLQNEKKAKTKLRVFVIGSPSPAELKANHPYQFVDAARFQGVNESTVWIVEKTGYEAGGVDLNRIEGYISAGRLIWLTPNSSLVRILNKFKAKSIRRFSVFSHGVPGQVTLRYGWSKRGMANYGLSIPSIQSLNKEIFAQNARVVFDSCNTGTSDFYSPRGNFAQQFATQTGQDVIAWTGRTSYAEVNDGKEDGNSNVEASRMLRWRGLRPSIDWNEVASQYGIGRIPRRRRFFPVRGRRSGGFQSHFEIRRRLPSTRTFEVPEQGGVTVTCPNPELVIAAESGSLLTRGSSYTSSGTAFEDERRYQTRRRQLSGTFWVALYRKEWFRDPGLGMHTFNVEPNSEKAIWTNLSAGTYYLEIYRRGGNSNYPIRSDMNVKVYGN